MTELHGGMTIEEYEKEWLALRAAAALRWRLASRDPRRISMRRFLLALGSVLALLPIHVQAQTRQPTIRIDNFSKNGQRQGYSIVDPSSGRIDSYDNQQNRTGYGYVTPTPNEIRNEQRGDQIDRQQGRERTDP